MKNIEEFKNNVDLYSADLSRWPAGLVKPALALKETSAEAREYFEAALKLDAALRSMGRAEKTYPKLEAKIMQSITDMPQVKSPASSGMRGFSFRASNLFAPGGGLLAVLIIGLFVGFQPPSQPKHDPLSIETLLFAEDYLAVDEEDYEDDIFDEGVF